MTAERYTTPQQLTSLVEACAHGQNVLLLSDYDGVWAPIVSRPEDAAPSQDTFATLQSLTSLPQFTTVLISGRRYQDMDAWFGGLTIEMSAEHGVLRRTKDGIWVQQKFMDDTVRTGVEQAMQAATYVVPGSHIEHKKAGMAWHYRVPSEADRKRAEVAAAHAKQLNKDLRRLAPATELQIIPGHMVVDVQPGGTSKGEAAQYWLKPGVFDVVVAIGDDVTDRSMLDAAEAYEGAQTFDISVGDTIQAKWRLKDPASVRKLFDRIVYSRQQYLRGK